MHRAGLLIIDRLLAREQHNGPPRADRTAESSLTRNYVLDTNILLHDPGAIHAFDEHTVVIPIDVLEELDSFKTRPNGLGRNSREVIRRLERLRLQGSLADGVTTDQGGKVRVDTNIELEDGCLSGNSHDNRILSVAKRLQRSGHETIFLTKDINLRIKADAISVPTEDYRNKTIDPDQLYLGWRELTIPEDALNRFFNEKKLRVEEELHPNECVHLRSLESRKHTALGICSGKDPHELTPLPDSGPIFGVHPRNMEQRMAISLLMNPDISLVTLIGQAGTGKTLLALAAAMQMTIREKEYEKILVSRPIMPLGRDIGYLPGTKDEKLELWMQPIFDNMTFLLNPKRAAEGERRVNDLMRSGIVQLEALTYIRGRSIYNQYVIVDEAQNLTPHEVKTIISRAGDETKVVLTGDHQQIDNPYLNSATNGLVYVAERMKNQRLAAHITLAKSERSSLASVAAEVL